MWHDIVVAFCLVLVIEGILPFLSPASWRKAILMAVQMDDRSLRVVGLVSMLVGLSVLHFING